MVHEVELHRNGATNIETIIYVEYFNSGVRDSQQRNSCCGKIRLEKPLVAWNKIVLSTSQEIQFYISHCCSIQHPGGQISEKGILPLFACGHVLIFLNCSSANWSDIESSLLNMVTLFSKCYSLKNAIWALERDSLGEKTFVKCLLY